MKEVRIDFVAPFVTAFEVGKFVNARAGEALVAVNNMKGVQSEGYEPKVQGIGILIGLIVFLLFRYLMLVSGAFPPLFFPLRFLPSWKKYIVYYGVLYYGENVNKICALYNQGQMAEAAYEFSILAGIDLHEAERALTFWKRIYGEGILTAGRRKEIKTWTVSKE